MASLVYIRSARPAWSTEEVLGQPRLTVRPYFKKKKKGTQNILYSLISSIKKESNVQMQVDTEGNQPELSPE